MAAIPVDALGGVGIGCGDREGRGVITTVAPVSVVPRMVAVLQAASCGWIGWAAGCSQDLCGPTGHA